MADADVVRFQVIVDIAQTVKFLQESGELNADLHHTLQGESGGRFCIDQVL